MVISPSSELGIAGHFFFRLLILLGILFQNFIFFLNRIDQLEPIQSDHYASLYGALILEPKSYLVRAHKPQISPRHGLGPFLGHVMGCLQPTLGPRGYLVVKQMS